MGAYLRERLIEVNTVIKLSKQEEKVKCLHFESALLLFWLGASYCSLRNIKRVLKRVLKQINYMLETFHLLRSCRKSYNYLLERVERSDHVTL